MSESVIDGPLKEEEGFPEAGHPKWLYTLFFSEMWERFCYYGMRALLLLYLTESLVKGDNEAFLIYGAYTALVYVAPVLGGKLADQLLGYRNAVLLGGVLMAIGEFLILGGTETWLYIGMGAIIVGNGYFKANISSIVGKLYKDGDPRKDSGFTIFYIGIYIGALLATTVCAEVGKEFGAPYGFGLAGIGMIVGTIIFQLGRKNFESKALPPDPQKLNAPWMGPLSRFHVTIIGSLAIIPAIYGLMLFPEVVGYLLAVTAVLVIYNLLSGAIKEGPIWRDRMFAMLIMFAFNIVFWACFEQAGSSLTLFAGRNVDRVIFGWEMGAATTQFFNPAYILIFGSIFSIMWIKLTQMGKNPNIPAKFGLGILQLGLGYLVVYLASGLVGEDYLVPLWTLALLYLLHTTGELFLSPIGLSMVTKLAPKHMTGTAMGGWFLSFAASNYVAGILATATGQSHGGEGGDEEAVVTAADSLAQNVDVYTTKGLITVGVGILLVILSKPINKLLHGVT
ncbi:MAG: peptide MFS transporter [Salibacteraceae bacterium]